MDTIVTRRLPVLWTPEEDNVIIEKVKQYPTNLQHAFSEAAISLDRRSRKSISVHWYNKLRVRSNVDAISVGSERGFSKNTKNVARKDGVMQEQDLRPHLYVLKQIFCLTPNERQELIRILTTDF